MPAESVGKDEASEPASQQASRPSSSLCKYGVRGCRLNGDVRLGVGDGATLVRYRSALLMPTDATRPARGARLSLGLYSQPDVSNYLRSVIMYPLYYIQNFRQGHCIAIYFNDTLYMSHVSILAPRCRGPTYTTAKGPPGATSGEPSSLRSLIGRIVCSAVTECEFSHCQNCHPRKRDSNSVQLWNQKFLLLSNYLDS